MRVSLFLIGVCWGALAFGGPPTSGFDAPTGCKSTSVLWVQGFSHNSCTEALQNVGNKDALVTQLYAKCAEVCSAGMTYIEEISEVIRPAPGQCEPWNDDGLELYDFWHKRIWEYKCDVYPGLSQ